MASILRLDRFKLMLNQDGRSITRISVRDYKKTTGHSTAFVAANRIVDAKEVFDCFFSP
jgi:hypothetical protein